MGKEKESPVSEVYQQLNQAQFCPTMTFFGLNHIKTDAETTYFDVTFPAESLNPMGFVQGGMITAALDDATSIVMIGGYDRKKAPLSTNLHILFHRPMSEGLGHIEVKIINLGRKSATSEGRLFDPNQKLIATLLHSAQPVETGR